ncbi:MAG: Rossman fold protein, TIGR00730 family [Gammaproteobacteria bacterium RIFCSPHIGHO2_12_FULL_41_15]|nr:MAG: Rossman fold protein, TIGR00730 family [Gammaproteobacteria bacterium RIFCSPHIGHO2_12_FULL_41_15]
MLKSIAVFCGSSPGISETFGESTEKLAETMAQAGISLVYGGANVGLMGILADKMLTSGSRVIGVIPKSLVDVEIAHTGLTDLQIVNSMHERKARIAALADGFIMLPGGPGSLDEFFEMLTWAQLGYHSKPCGILNVDHYYDDLLKFLDHAVTQGFFKLVHRNMIIVEASPQRLIERLKQYIPPLNKKWVNEV